jgi:hypothetical protein
VSAVLLDADEADEAEVDPREESLMDKRTWTLDRRLAAATINAINLNTAATGQWSEKPPDFPTVGPLSWQEGEPAKKEEEVFKDNFDFFRKKGFPLG